MKISTWKAVVLKKYAWSLYLVQTHIPNHDWLWSSKHLLTSHRIRVLWIILLWISDIIPVLGPLLVFIFNLSNQLVTYTLFISIWWEEDAGAWKGKGICSQSGCPGSYFILFIIFDSPSLCPSFVSSLVIFSRPGIGFSPFLAAITSLSLNI